MDRDLDGTRSVADGDARRVNDSCEFCHNSEFRSRLRLASGRRMVGSIEDIGKKLMYSCQSTTLA